VLGIALVLLALGSTTVGSVHLPAGAILSVLGAGPGADDVARTILLQVRLPRIVLAAVVGVALAASGTVLQGVFRNPMADPYIIGVSAGAALGATAAIVFGFTVFVLGVSGVSLAAFAGALLVTLLVYRLAWFRGEVVVEYLLLAGVAVGAFLAAIISAMQLLGGESLQQVIFWLMGGFAGRSWQHVLWTVPYVAAGYLIAWAQARNLNLLVLGDETAQSLGARPGQVRGALIAAASLMAAAAVAASGLIGFVGLVVPHLMRLVVGPDHRRLLPAAALAGGCTMLIADTVARWAAAPGEIPVGIVTAFLGAPFFLYLLRRQRRKTSWS